MIEPYAGQVKKGLQKASGQLDTVIKMAEADRYCMDIIQQNNAVIGILQQANNLILESHLRTCGVALASKSKGERDRFIKEILRVCNVWRKK
ncbi:MAG: metal-sensing transcriptional repressor [Patescibacteria group bacterium]|jgi:DNA-binding FrmR family transcriptional regulator